MQLLLRTIYAALLMTALFGGSPAHADDAGEGRGEGEVRRVDLERGTVVIRHGDIEGMRDMPAMTMTFRTLDPAMLEQMKPGDRIRFTVSRAGGAITILKFEKLR